MTAKRLLFVDDDAIFLEAITRLFRVWSKGELEIVPVTSPGQAIQQFQTGAFDLVVLDVRMPVVDGVQFLQLLQRKLPDVLKVVLTGYPDEATRAHCLGAGASLFLGKPRTPDEMESVYTALHTLVMLEPEEGFRGVLQRVGLHDVLQMECLAGKTSLLEIRAGENIGHIFIRHGAVVDAQANDLDGEEAFYGLMSWRGGNFRFLPFREPPRASIAVSLDGLLLESALRQDQALLAPAASPVVPRQFKRTVRVPAPPAAAPPAAPTPPSPAPAQPALPAEVVVCDLAGEFMFDWHSPNSDLRGVFLEFLRAKSDTFNRLSAGALGGLSRLEIHGAESRAVAVLAPTRSLFASADRGGLDAAALGDFLTRDVDGFIVEHSRGG